MTEAQPADAYADLVVADGVAGITPGVRRVLVGSPVVEPLERVILQHGPVDAIAWLPLAPGELTAAVKRAA